MRYNYSFLLCCIWRQSLLLVCVCRNIYVWCWNMWKVVIVAHCWKTLVDHCHLIWQGQCIVHIQSNHMRRWNSIFCLANYLTLHIYSPKRFYTILSICWFLLKSNFMHLMLVALQKGHMACNISWSNGKLRELNFIYVEHEKIGHSIKCLVSLLTNLVEDKLCLCMCMFSVRTAETFK